jgi:hypothetical protein
MPSLKALESLIAQYELTSDCFKISARATKGKVTELLEGTTFETNRRTAQKKIQKTRADTADLAVAAMWAYFERELIEYVQRKGEKLARLRPKPFTTNFSAKVASEIEYWRFPEILDLFSGHIDPNLLGHAKQIKRFRDWVVHRNPNKPTPSKTDPLIAYKVFKDIITQVKGL